MSYQPFRDGAAVLQRSGERMLWGKAILDRNHDQRTGLADLGEQEILSVLYPRSKEKCHFSCLCHG
jgi:hypothetical protein